MPCPVTGVEPAAVPLWATAVAADFTALRASRGRWFVRQLGKKKSTCFSASAFLNPSDWSRTSGLLNPIQSKTLYFQGFPGPNEQYMSNRPGQKKQEKSPIPLVDFCHFLYHNLYYFTKDMGVITFEDQ